LRLRQGRYHRNMPKAAAQPTGGVIVDARGCVAEDIPCLRCSYNLRGLSPDRACPECGEPLANSVPRGIDPRWLRLVSLGFAFLGAACLASPVAHLAQNFRERIVLLIVEALYMVVCVLAVLPEPEEPVTPQAARVRRTVLWSAGAIVALDAFDLGL